MVWNRRFAQLVPAPLEARHQLAKWGGPEVDAWSHKETLENAQWLFIAELVSGPHNPSAQQLQQESSRLHLKIAWLFHDAIPLRWAHLYGTQAMASAGAHAAYMDGLARFDLVLANSQTTAIHLRQHWRKQGLNSRARLRALPLATELPAQARLPAPHGGESLVLCVGSLEPRKNHQGLLKALAYLVAEGRWPSSYILVIVGWANDGRVVELVQRARALELPLRWEQEVDDLRLRQLYAEAAFSVYPSLEEGFGLPVAESLWHRRPCVCSDSGALGELAAGGGCYPVNTGDWRALTKAMYQLLHDLALRQHLQHSITEHRPRLWCEVAVEWLQQVQIAST